MDENTMRKIILSIAVLLMGTTIHAQSLFSGEPYVWSITTQDDVAEAICQAAIVAHGSYSCPCFSAVHSYLSSVGWSMATAANGDLQATDKTGDVLMWIKKAVDNRDTVEEVRIRVRKQTWGEYMVSKSVAMVFFVYPNDYGFQHGMTQITTAKSSSNKVGQWFADKFGAEKKPNSVWRSARGDFTAEVYVFDDVGNDVQVNFRNK